MTPNSSHEVFSTVKGNWKVVARPQSGICRRKFNRAWTQKLFVSKPAPETPVVPIFGEAGGNKASMPP